MWKVNDELITRDELIARLEARDGHFCFLCKKSFAVGEKPTIDHWFPQSMAKKFGWTYDQINDFENLRLSHSLCNSKKSNLVPDENGEVPERPSIPKAPKRSERPEICSTCNNGRLLNEGDICGVCGSLPQPLKYPHWAKVKPSECPHEYPWWCWLEALEPGLRRPAIYDVLDADHLDNS